jgi:hypothetical protein
MPAWRSLRTRSGVSAYRNTQAISAAMAGDFMTMLSGKNAIKPRST